MYIKNKDLLPKLIIFGFYIIVFIGNLIYLIYICIKININNNCTDLKKIESDDNIKDYIKDICKIIDQKLFLIISGFFLFLVSLILFIIAWFFEKLYEPYLRIKGRKLDLQWRYMERKYNLSY